MKSFKKCSILLLVSALVSPLGMASQVQEEFEASCMAWLVKGEPALRRFAAINPADPIPVTGSGSYPTPLVLRNLGLGTWNDRWAGIQWRPSLVYVEGLDAEAARQLLATPRPPLGTALLSLGEGRSGLVPYLVKNQGMEAYGIDPANNLETGVVDAYFGRNYQASLDGDARDLSNIADDSYPMVVSHMLLPYFGKDDRIRILQESFRVMAPGGTVRHSILVPNVNEVLGPEDLSEHQMSALADEVKQLLKEALVDGSYQAAAFLTENSPRHSGETRSLNLLLILQKPARSWWKFW